MVLFPQDFMSIKIKEVKKMAEKNFFLPESRYSPTYLPDWKIYPDYYVGKIVHVLPTEFLAKSKKLFVSGENFDGIIQEEDLSIYPVTYFEHSNMPRFLPKLFNGCITAKIIGFSNDVFQLSRKASMQEALSTLSIGKIVTAKKIAYLNQKTTFADIGAGITAIIPLSEVTSSRINDVAIIFDKMDYIPVKIIAESAKHKNRFIVSYKQTIPPKPIQEGDIVRGKVVGLLPDKTGVFVELSPTQAGIADLEGLTIVNQYEANEFSNSDSFIVFGNYYSFYVKRIKDTKNFQNSQHYSLRFT